jgi:YesN/AraC family two-component response regulator
MTTDDLRSEIAAIRATLSHIEATLEKQDEHRSETTRTITNFLERLVKLEASGGQLATIPERVAHAEAANEVQDAIRSERAQTVKEIRQIVFGGIAAAASLATILALVLSYYVGNGP